jgi:hypothetical protein
MSPGDWIIDALLVVAGVVEGGAVGRGRRAARRYGGIRAQPAAVVAMGVMR